MLGFRMMEAFKPSGGSGSSYRYFRIYVTATNYTINSAVVLYEAELSLTAGGANIFTPGMTVTSNGDYSISYAVSKIIDGSLTSYWYSSGTAFPHYAIVDTAGSFSPEELRLYISNPQNPKDFIFQGSNDGTSWTDLQSFTGVVVSSTRSWHTFNLLTGAWS